MLHAVIRNFKADCHVVGYSILAYTDSCDDAGALTIRDLIMEVIGDWLP